MLTADTHHISGYKCDLCENTFDSQYKPLSVSYVITKTNKEVITGTSEVDYYEEYTEFYDPLTIAQDMGVLPMLQRDTTMSIAGIFDGLFDGNKGDDEFSWENSLGDVTEEWQPDESTSVRRKRHRTRKLHSHRNLQSL